ncbi:hypothetical protein [Paludibaculum fermentans]|uniref:hypothetical protein n=1 Tax=Paludibaculum fermentans TaxID=1473598 RepID=UPI003EBBDEE2
MPMMLHIFLKDARRLWWAVLATWVPLAALSWLDSWRTDWLIDAPEGWLNLLLPLAWACLTAMVVQEEPLADPDHFWITWPYRWPALLGSKVLFVIVFLHVPALVADCAVVSAHGFPLGHSMPALLGKQAVLAAVVTGPAMAMAAVCRRIPHFLVAAILLFGGAAYLAAFSGTVPPWTVPDEMRRRLPAGVVALAAALVIVLQYSRRRTTSSRVVGAVSVAAAAVLFAGLTPALTARLRVALNPKQAVLALRLSDARPEAPRTFRAGRTEATFVSIALPVTITPAPGAAEYLIDRPQVEITGAEGQRLRSVVPTPGHRPGPSDVLANFVLNDHGQDWLGLRIPRRAMDQIQAGRVTIVGRSTVNFVSRGETTWIAAGSGAAVPGLGRCMTEELTGQDAYREGLLKVVCEALTPISPLTEVRLWNEGMGRSWRRHLGDSAPVVYGPRTAWLSPLHRLQTHFQLAAGARRPLPGNGWLVPPEALTGGRVAITPGAMGESAALAIELRGVALGAFVVTSGE